MGNRAKAKWLKSGGSAVPRGGREMGPHLTQCRLGRGLPKYQVASWSIQPFAHNTPQLRYRQENGPVAYGGPLLVTVARKTAINDARLAPTAKPEVEIWRKPALIDTKFDMVMHIGPLHAIDR